MTLTELTHAIARKWVARYGLDSLSGNCGKLAGRLEREMTRAGFSGQWMQGRIDGQFGLHCWIETDVLILDPSAQQYDETAPLVLTKPAPHYIGTKLYSF